MRKKSQSVEVRFRIKPEIDGKLRRFSEGVGLQYPGEAARYLMLRGLQSSVTEITQWQAVGMALQAVQDAESVMESGDLEGLQAVFQKERVKQEKRIEKTVAAGAPDAPRSGSAAGGRK